MVYEIKWTEVASKQLGKLDRTVQKRIIKKPEPVRQDPFAHAARLAALGAYKKIGDYTIIAAVERDKPATLILKIGLR